MNDSLARPIRKFNPGTLQSDGEVIRQFVVRQRELTAVLEVLRANAGSPSCQHTLLVAPRGRGKTMLLARVAAELRTDGDLSRRLMPIRFMEESHEIFTLGDFWLETLFYLAKEITGRHPELARELLGTHADLAARWQGEELAGRARAAVLETADRLGRQVVLMVENLQALCGNVEDDFGWKLREALQSEPQIMLLATATARFKGLDDATQPFFELFRIVYLERLDTDDCGRLWETVCGDKRTRNIRPLQILTGGSPRLLVIVAEFARHRSLRQLMEELVKLIDDHTEYFRVHLEVLAKTERRVYLATLDLWQPSSTSEIAARARMDVRIVSALLGRLVDRGALTVEGTGRKRLYAAAERLYGIYYKLRRERDEASVVRNLIHFMATFYTGPELARLSRELVWEAVQSPVIREGFRRAIVEASRIGPVGPEVMPPVIDKIYALATMIHCKNIVDEIRAALKEDRFEDVIEAADRLLISRNTASPRTLDLVNVWTLNMKMLAQSELGQTDTAIATCDDMVEGFGVNLAPEIQVQVARALTYKGIIQRDAGKPETAITTCNELIERLGRSTAPELQAQVAMALVTKGLAQGQLRAAETAVATYDEAIERFGASTAPELQQPVATALVNKSKMQARLGDSEAAMATCAEVIARFANSESLELQALFAEALADKGAAQGQLGHAKVAMATCQEVIERFGNRHEQKFQAVVARATVNKGVSQGKLGDAESAAATCDAVVDRFGTDDAPEIQAQVAHALVVKAGAQHLLGRADAALSTCDEIQRRCGVLTDDRDIAFDSLAECIRTMALVSQEQRAPALSAFRSLYAAVASENVAMTRMLLALTCYMVAWGMPERELVEILSSDTDKCDALAPLVVALRQRAGESVRAAVEVVEVAADVRAQIEKAADAARDSAPSGAAAT